MRIPFVKIKIIFHTTIKKIRSFPLFVAKNIFPSFVGLFIIVIIIGAFVYYYYGIVAQVGDKQTKVEVPQLDRVILKDVLERIDDKENRLKAVDTTEYPDPFNPVVVLEPKAVDQ
ncbi:MAG: hypothetical protein V1905_00445 [bacterium]